MKYSKIEFFISRQGDKLIYSDLNIKYRLKINIYDQIQSFKKEIAELYEIYDICEYKFYFQRIDEDDKNIYDINFIYSEINKFIKEDHEIIKVFMEKKRKSKYSLNECKEIVPGFETKKIYKNLLNYNDFYRTKKIQRYETLSLTLSEIDKNDLIKNRIDIICNTLILIIENSECINLFNDNVNISFKIKNLILNIFFNETDTLSLLSILKLIEKFSNSDILLELKFSNVIFEPNVSQYKNSFENLIKLTNVSIEDEYFSLYEKNQIDNFLNFLNKFQLKEMSNLRIKNFKFITDEHCSLLFKNILNQTKFLTSIELENIRLEYNPEIYFELSNILRFDSRIELHHLSNIKFKKCLLLNINTKITDNYFISSIRKFYFDKQSIINLDSYNLIRKKNNMLYLNFNSNIINDFFEDKNKLKSNQGINMISIGFNEINNSNIELLLDNDVLRTNKNSIIDIKIDNLVLINPNDNKLYEFVNNLLKLKNLKLYNVINTFIIQLDKLNPKLNKLKIDSCNIDIKESDKIDIKKFSLKLGNLMIMNKYYSLPNSCFDKTIKTLIKIISSNNLNVITFKGILINYVLEWNEIKQALLNKRNLLMIKLKQIDNIKITTLCNFIETYSKHNIKIYMNLYSLRQLIWENENSSLINCINKDTTNISYFANLKMLLENINHEIEIIFNYKNVMEYNEIKFIFYIYFSKYNEDHNKNNFFENDLKDNLVKSDEIYINLKRKISNRVNEYLCKHDFFNNLVFKLK